MRWSGTSWVAIGGPAEVLAFATWDDGAGLALYAAGRFGPAPAFSGVCRLVGSTWVGIGAGSFATMPLALIAFDQDGAGPMTETLCVGGPFGVRLLLAGVWTSIGTSHTRALCAYDADGAGPGTPLLVAGGSFAALGTDWIAGWNGTNWVTFGIGIQTFSNGMFFSGSVQTVGAFDLGSGPVLVAGGLFTHAGGLPMTSLAQWNGTAWSSLGNFDGTPIVPSVLALAMFDDGTGPKLHAGGYFASAGGVPASNFARLDA